jgi:alkylation response protein AidB-like acyl-CoA dehydrogenase
MERRADDARVRAGRGHTGIGRDGRATPRRVRPARDPVVRQLIAKAHTNAYVHGQLARRIAQHLRIDPSAAAGIASYGKLAAGTFFPIRARIGMEIGGPAALLWDDEDVEEQRPSLEHLNSRIMSIAGGTNEMQRNAIGERVLGLPREPSFDTKKPFREVLRDAADWK